MKREAQDNLLKALIVCGIMLFSIYFMAAMDVTTGLVSRLIPTGELFLVVLVALLVGSIWIAWRINLPVKWYFYRDQEAEEEQAPAAPVTPTPTVQPTVQGGRHRSYFAASSQRPMRRRAVGG